MSTKIQQLFNDTQSGKYSWLHIHITNQERYDFVVALCNKYNINMDCSYGFYQEHIPFYMTAHTRTKSVHYNFVNPSDTTPLISLDDVEELFSLINKQEKPIVINGSKVEFLDNGDIKVGCTTIPYNTIVKIYKKAAENAQRQAEP
jgi:hypothetical protein